MDDFWFLKIINIFLASLFFSWAWCIKKVVGVWLNPASIFLLFWFFFTAFPLIIAFEVPVDPWAIIYIFLFCFFFSLPSFLFHWSYALTRNECKLSAEHYFDTPVMASALYFFAAFSVSMVFLSVLQQGISITQLLEDPVAVGGIYAGKRYSGEIVPSLYAQLGLQCSYYTAALGGLVYGSRRKVRGKTILLILVFLPALLVMFLQSAKGLFFFSMFLFLGGILVSKIYNKDLTLIDLSGIRKIFLYGFLFLPILLVSFLSRGIYQLNDTVLIINRLRFYLISYSSVHLPAFSDWFSERYLSGSLLQYKQEFLTTGFYTFMSFFQLAGDNRSVPMGVYDEYFTYGDYIKGNLFTVFRGLITDFGLMGSMVFALIVGSISCIGYWLLLTQRKSAFAIVFFVYFVAISYQTFVISSLTWLTIPFVFLIQWTMLFFMMKVKIYSRIEK
ncbi:O-antigen polymerase [Pollutimonas harenae]|uniref:Oligosaccharide repeat unit polymerase n=1 Tax=Pollutimonas harenae TaxID=657015 RepID=A0A853GZ50_9BURK|nr:O-antigen polymerase [Pollutimonas harenae]NYT84335.1 oligosaccharide repeat unit polymerase [Pollutimonas harenae]TEA73264.1 oligosaccharide repeat unit polymerase [Pollutimonas harenae]